jgi:glutamine synthetase
MKPKEVLGLIKDSEAKFVDFRFTDTKGKEQHVTTARCSTVRRSLAGRALMSRT